jgi:hypothetical protein
MNFKRKKTKRRVRCTMCTQYRWLGNNVGKKRISDLRNDDKAKIDQN